MLARPPHSGRRLGPARRGPVSRWIASLGLLPLAALVLALPSCRVNAQPVREVGLDRSTPRKAYEYLRTMVRARQVEAEWSAFSPGFKRRLSERAGRHVDLSDYAQARATVASNSTKEIGLLLESEFVSEERLSEDVAALTVKAGSRRATARLVRLTTWEVRLRGESQPVADFVKRAGDVVSISADGSVVTRVLPSSSAASFLREFQDDRIEAFRVEPEWFLDDFDDVGRLVAGGVLEEPRPPASRGASPQGGPPPRTSPPKTVPRPPAPPVGAPDGPTDGDLGSPG